jgi:hypothetical protein
MTNKEPEASNLTGKIKARLRRYMAGPQGITLEQLPAHTGSEPGITIYVDPDKKEDNRYVIDIFNESDTRIYPHIFYLNPDYSISRIYPNNHQDEPVSPIIEGNPFVVGMNAKNERLSLSLDPGWDTSSDYLKLIVTTKYVDLRVLQQSKLQVPLVSSSLRSSKGTIPRLQQLMETVASGGSFRSGTVESDIADEDWTTWGLPITVVRLSH